MTYYCWEASGNWDTEEEPREVSVGMTYGTKEDVAEKYIEDIYDNRDGWEYCDTFWDVFVRDNEGVVWTVQVDIDYTRNYSASTAKERAAE